uniref:Uncharacterized protein n=1 Tax=Setaria italica TaxID=4555 RepID=K3ZZ15_SETIT
MQNITILDSNIPNTVANIFFNKAQKQKSDKIIQTLASYNLKNLTTVNWVPD